MHLHGAGGQWQVHRCTAWTYSATVHRCMCLYTWCTSLRAVRSSVQFFSQTCGGKCFSLTKERPLTSAPIPNMLMGKALGYAAGTRKGHQEPQKLRRTQGISGSLGCNRGMSMNLHQCVPNGTGSLAAAICSTEPPPQLGGPIPDLGDKVHTMRFGEEEMVLTKVVFYPNTCTLTW